jgi:polysaccharide chain length determinant protein (PEP-CTERM system associated)
VLPGQKFTIEDVMRIARRRAWLIIVPLMIGAAVAVVYGRRLPDLYKSETVILVVPQRIPDAYVRSTVTGRIESRVATISDQLLSRSRLERIIVDLNLYPTERRTGTMDDVVAKMRSDISVALSGRESFRVTYVARDPQVAQVTAQRLASLFIEENLRDRENLAVDTSEFLDSQLEEAKRRLVEHEKKLEEYRRHYSGQLPTQGPANLQAIQNLQGQIAGLAESADREQDRRLLLERQLADLEAPDPLAAAGGVTADGRREPAAETPAQRYEATRAALALLRTQKTADHPDVKALERALHDLEAEMNKSASDPSAAGATQKVLSPADLLRQRRLRDLREQIADIDRSLAEKQQRDVQLRAALADYQAKVDAIPTRESEMVSLTRDYATLQSTYQSLLAKREDSKIAVNLERRNIGEQFQVLDPAKAPDRPFSPNRLRIQLMGAAAGLLFGLAVAGFLEYRDTSFKSDDDVARLLAVPVFAVVPNMWSADEERSFTRRRWMTRVGMSLVVVGAAVLIWRLQS